MKGRKDPAFYRGWVSGRCYLRRPGISTVDFSEWEEDFGDDKEGLRRAEEDFMRKRYAACMRGSVDGVTIEQWTVDPYQPYRCVDFVYNAKEADDIGIPLAHQRYLFLQSQGVDLWSTTMLMKVFPPAEFDAIMAKLRKGEEAFDKMELEFPPIE